MDDLMVVYLADRGIEETPQEILKRIKAQTLQQVYAGQLCFKSVDYDNSDEYLRRLLSVSDVGLCVVLHREGRIFVGDGQLYHATGKFHKIYMYQIVTVENANLLKEYMLNVEYPHRIKELTEKKKKAEEQIRKYDKEIKKLEERLKNKKVEGV